MSSWSIAVTDAYPSPQTAAPAITFRAHIEDRSGMRVHAAALRCRVQIEPRGRRYTKDEQRRLYELFGHLSQWDRTLQSVTWAHTSIVVPSFEAQIAIEMPVACTYDLEVGSSKYLHAIRDGDVPLAFLFSGTIFRTGPDGLVVEPVSWDLDAPFRMPAGIWRAAMDQFFPGGGWVRLQRDTIDRLQAVRGRFAVLTFDEAIEYLLRTAAIDDPPAPPDAPGSHHVPIAGLRAAGRG